MNADLPSYLSLKRDAGESEIELLSAFLVIRRSDKASSTAPLTERMLIQRSLMH